MENVYYFLFILVLLSAFVMAAQKSLYDNVRMYRIQSVIIFILALLLVREEFSIHIIVAVAATLALKVLYFPYAIEKTLKRLHITDRIENAITIRSLVLFAAVLGCISLVIFSNARLGLTSSLSTHVLPIAVSIFFFGLVMMISRKKTISQVLAFLIMENGLALILLFGLQSVSIALEIGLTVDVLIALILMGILTYQIKGSVDHIDTSELKELTD